VVISTQLAPAYEAEYFRHGRSRMFRTLRAYYGPSPSALVRLRERYGVTHLWLRRGALRREMAGEGVRWRRGRLPYGAYVRGMLDAGEPAVLDLPRACLRWRGGQEEVYDVACVAGELPPARLTASPAG
jgi:hypothetical protein